MAEHVAHGVIRARTARPRAPEGSLAAPSLSAAGALAAHGAMVARFLHAERVDAVGVRLLLLTEAGVRILNVDQLVLVADDGGGVVNWAGGQRITDGPHAERRMPRDRHRRAARPRSRHADGGRIDELASPASPK